MHVILVVFYVLQLLRYLPLPFCLPYRNMMTKLCNVQCYMLFNCHKMLGNMLRRWATISISGNTEFWMCFVLWSIVYGFVLWSAVYCFVLWSLVYFLMLWSVVYCFVLWSAVYCVAILSVVYCFLLWSLMYCLVLWSVVYCFELWSAVYCVVI